MQPRTSEKGFTILLAALVASLVLSLGIAVFSIAQKQLILSSTGRNSQYAFYAADTAAECALYWDVRHNSFGTSTPDVTPECAEQYLSIGEYPEAEAYPYTLYFEFQPNDYCAQVYVTKRIAPPAGERWRTLIRANGFSVACDQLGVSDRALQRSVELSY